MSDQKKSSDQSAAELLGQKLGLFISTMPVSDEVKASMVKAALLMDEGELVEFVSRLEVEYANFKTQDVDKEFEKDLAGIKNKFAAKKSALKTETQSALADLESELDSL